MYVLRLKYTTHEWVVSEEQLQALLDQIPIRVRKYQLTIRKVNQ